MDFECDPPIEWRASGLPEGWEASASKNGKQWPWSLKRSGGGPMIVLTGVADSADEAKGAIVDAYERLQYAFCTESPEDMPHALSSMLAAGEMAAKQAGMSKIHREDFEQSSAFARRVLSRLPKPLRDPRVRGNERSDPSDNGCRCPCALCAQANESPFGGNHCHVTTRGCV